MILVTLGTQDKSFTRLLDAVQEQINKGNIKDRVVVQAGCTNYSSNDMEIFDLIPKDDFEKLISECDLLITHGGVSSILTGLKNNKKVIAVARLKQYGEHTNDHQLQIIENFTKSGYILSVDDFSELGKIIKKAQKFKPKKYKSNTKNMIKLIDQYIEKTNKESRKTNIYDKIFAFIFLIVIFAGLGFTILSRKTINYAENRVANILPGISYKEIINKNYQDKVSLAFEDQIPLSSSLKSIYNNVNSKLQYELSQILAEKYCSNNYMKVKKNISTFGCDNYLVYDYTKLEENIDAYNSRINNVNKLIENSNVDVYVYYIEKDTDIDFKTNEKSGIADYLFSNIKTDKTEKFLISNFDDYKTNFYKTDHHWNYRGSYKAYLSIVKQLLNEEPLKIQSEKCVSDHFSGSKAFFAGASAIYKENFCVYLYNFPNYEILINGKSLNYGNESYYLSGNSDDLSYGSYYGNDDGEIIINTNNENKQNLLIIGSSYDNAIAKLIAAHFNKTFIIDLRNYQRDLNKKFNYKEYIETNEINKVLLIGDSNYFSSPEFDVEE